MNLAHFDNPMNKVKGYKPSLIKNVRILELEAATAVGVGLFALSVEYVGSLGVAPVVKRDMKTLLSAAVTQSKNNFFPILSKDLHGQLNPTEKAVFGQMMQALNTERAKEAQLSVEALLAAGGGGSSSGPVPQEESSPNKRAHEEAPAAVVSVTKRRAEGSDDLPARKSVADLPSTELKVAKILEISACCPASKNLTEPARKFVKRTMRPVETCLANHFCGDVVAFCDHWRASFFKIKFKTGCCKGEGISCSLEMSKLNLLFLRILP